MQAGANLDAAWIDASLQGDRTAFAQIIERYHRAVYAVAFSTVRDRALADDITQDTFVTAWRRLDELRDRSRLPAWLCGIARNLGRDARKRGRREVLGEPAEPADTATPYDDLSDAESERLVAIALGQIPDVYREPLVLHYYEDQSVEDVARSLGISPATTHKRLSRGRRYLADNVASIFDRGAAPRGRPAHALVAGVLAAIGITAPASHVDASPLVSKGSTMHKLAIAATVAAALGGAGIIVATTGDAAVRPGATPPPATPASTTQSSAAAPSAEHCDLAAHLKAATRGVTPPSLTTPPSSTTASTAASADAPPDCATLGRHLAELEADTTHGPNHRPDEATCEQCASHYVNQCENEGWSPERRACALAAGDLINAHLCAGSIPKTTQPTTIPPSLSCATLGAHIATTVQSAGIYADVADMPQQLEAACDLGGWPLTLRQCFSAATTVPALQACVVPPAPAP